VAAVDVDVILPGRRDFAGKADVKDLCAMLADEYARRK
jgi:hypothetical protein